MTTTEAFCRLLPVSLKENKLVVVAPEEITDEEGYLIPNQLKRSMNK